MPIRVVVPAEVELEILEIDDWWRRNRAAAADLFAEELAATLDLISREPLVGRRYPHPRLPGAQRVLLRATRYHVYYRVDGDRLTLLAIWSAIRGCGPSFT